MIENRIHELDEFASLPWSSLDPERVGKDWSVGRGGYGFGDHTWSLKVYSDDADCSADIWELPASLGAIFVMLREAQANSTREEIRRVLGF